MGQARDYIGFIDAAYDFASDDESWLRGLARAARLGFGIENLGAYALRYDASAPAAFKVTAFEDDGMAAPLAEHFRVDVARFYAGHPELVAAAFRRTACGPAGAIPGMKRATVWAGLATIGVGDVAGINGLNPRGKGAHVGVPIPRIVRFDRDELTVWQRLAAHLAAAERLRDRVRMTTDRAGAADAVLSPRGKLLHATGESKVARARAALHEAVIDMEKARGALRRRDPARSVAMWRALADARWSLVEHYETDGKRYLLAERNDPATAPLDVLSARERQVVALVAMGQSNKLVAYELGIAASTVSVLLGRACRKLGAKTRGELTAAYLRCSKPRPES